MKKDLDQIKTEILSRLNIQSEYETLGVQFKGKPNSSGWLPCRSPWSPDKHPSCGVNISSGSYRGYLCVFNDNGSRGKPHTSHSFWDVAADFLPGAGGDFNHVLKHYAKKTGVKFGSGRKPPTKMMVDEFIEALPTDAREYLRSKRGFSDETIKKYEVGFRRFDKRNTFPVYDKNGELVNIRYHNSKLKPKTLNHSGFGQARLWGADRLKKASSASIVVITEGECFPGNVEILTPSGWIQFANYNGSNVFQVDEDGSGSFVTPSQFIQKPFVGNLINHSVKGWNSTTTPSHKLISVDRKGN